MAKHKVEFDFICTVEVDDGGIIVAIEDEFSDRDLVLEEMVQWDVILQGLLELYGDDQEYLSMIADSLEELARNLRDG